jgi:hypothetical protein
VAGLQLPIRHGFAVSITGAGPCAHVPLPSQRNAPTQRFELFPHAVPVGCAGFEHVPAAALHVPATWQASSAVHVTGAPAHVPLVQTSVVVQAFPSLQGVPFVIVGFVQAPVVGSHVPAAWHWSDAVQGIVPPPVHVPALHESFESQGLPSLHGVPSVTAGWEQAPVAGLHDPPAWHWSGAEQVTGFAPVHVPLWHESLCVQASPSLHGAPFGAIGFEHVPVNGSQFPATWHWSEAVHVTLDPGVQTPSLHVSLESHLLPSLHVVPSGKR